MSVSVLLNVSLALIGTASKGKLICHGPLIKDRNCKISRVVALCKEHDVESNNVEYSTHIEVFDEEDLDKIRELIHHQEVKQERFLELKSSLCDGHYFNSKEYCLHFSAKNSDADKRNAVAFQNMMRNFTNRLSGGYHSNELAMFE